MRIRLVIGPVTVESQQEAQILLLALWRLNIDLLTEFPGRWQRAEMDRLYERIQYQREPRDGQEEWKPIPAIFQDGHGDCEDLAAAYAAFETVGGRPAAPLITKVSAHQYHIIVQYADGSQRDISAELGMQGGFLGLANTRHDDIAARYANARRGHV